MLGRKALIILILIVALGVGGYYILAKSSLIDNIPGLGNSEQKMHKDKDKVELRGKKTCLKHRAGMADTRECKVGFRADDGKYYALTNIKLIEDVSPKKNVWIKGIYHKVKSTRYKHSGNIELQAVSLEYKTLGGLGL